jgi:hypothetical protein
MQAGLFAFAVYLIRVVLRCCSDVFSCSYYQVQYICCKLVCSNSVVTDIRKGVFKVFGKEEKI